MSRLVFLLATLAASSCVFRGVAGNDCKPDVFAPRHFRFAHPDGQKSLHVYFHSSFGEYESTSCSEYDENESACREHPRCHYQRSGPLCVLDRSYLWLLTKGDVCRMEHITDLELLAVGVDLVREGVITDDIPKVETSDICGLIVAAVGADFVQEEVEAGLLAHLRSFAASAISSSASFLSNQPSTSSDSPPPSRHFLGRTLRSSRRQSPLTAHSAQATTLQILERGPLECVTMTPKEPLPIGINGFGRIGRLVFRAAMERSNLVVRHINSPMAPDYMAYLIKHDTTHGPFNGEVHVEGDLLVVNGQRITLSSTRNPSEIPWKHAGVKYVCESTGAFCTTKDCMQHIRPDGAEKVVISAPAKDEETPTLVMGVNAHEDYNTAMKIVSCASCTTNALAPLVKVVHEKYGIVEGLMTTVHAATASQAVVDSSSKKDWRGGRAAFANIIPSSTGAAKAVAKCIPEMKGKLTGMAFRVPTVDVSVVDLTCRLSQGTTYEEIKKEIKKASESYMAGVIGYTEEPIVSSDLIGEKCSTVFDASAGIMLNEKFLKLISWYDNEYAYSNRLLDLITFMAVQDGAMQRRP